MQEKKPEVLVTGSEGFFGSWLIPALEADGYAVKRFDLKLGHDIADTDSLIKMARGCHAIIHLAAVVYDRDDVPWEEYHRVNVLGTKSVYQAFMRTRVRTMVHASTGAIYGFSGDNPDGWVSPPITEAQTPPRDVTLNKYARSKWKAEQVLLAYRGWRAITILRFNCIEPYDSKVHHGWWCSQATAIAAFLAALKRSRGGVSVVNVGEETAALDLSQFQRLLHDAQHAEQ